MDRSGMHTQELGPNLVCSNVQNNVFFGTYCPGLYQALRQETELQLIKPRQRRRSSHDVLALTYQRLCLFTRSVEVLMQIALTPGSVVCLAHAAMLSSVPNPSNFVKERP